MNIQNIKDGHDELLLKIIFKIILFKEASQEDIVKFKRKFHEFNEEDFINFFDELYLLDNMVHPPKSEELIDTNTSLVDNVSYSTRSKEIFNLLRDTHVNV
jgi:hypothetical protein